MSLPSSSSVYSAQSMYNEENTQNEYRYKSSEVDAYSLVNKRVV